MATQFFIENNLWYYSQTETEFPPKGDPGFGGGARFEYRFNVSSGFKGTPQVSWHGTDTSGRARQGGKAVVLANSITCNNATECGGSDLGPYNQRDGNLLAFLNQIHTAGGATNITFLDNIEEERAFRNTAYGICDGTTPYDVNDGEVLTGPFTLTGVSGSVLSAAAAPWTSGAFNFTPSSPGAHIFTVWDATTGSNAFIVSNTATSLTIAGFTNVGLNGSGFSSGDDVRIMQTTLYAAGTNTGATGASVPTDSSKSFTANQWVSSGTPWSLVNVTQGWGSTIAANSATSFTYDFGPEQNGGTGFTWTNGDAYAITRATQCLDQPGRIEEQAITSPTVSAGVPAPFQPSALLSPTYEGDDTVDVGVSVTNIVKVTQSLRFLANRDYYSESLNQGAQTTATSPFDGTSGVGHGTLALRPTTCTKGVGYFAADQGAWNQSGGSNPISYKEQGELFTCSATNTWTLYYTPFCYPHPLVSGVPCSAEGMDGGVGDGGGGLGDAGLGGDSGHGDAGSGADSGLGEDSGTTSGDAPRSSSGCGCELASLTRSRRPIAMLSLLVVLALVRRRRVRAEDE